MRYLGIDYGDKRVGLAVSDENLTLAFPLLVIKNSKHLLDEIGIIINEKGVEKIVVGESLNLNGEPNIIMGDIEKFVENLIEKTKLEVIYEPEFLTSVQAEKFEPRRSDTTTEGVRSGVWKADPKLLDASSAAIILQSYLDRIKGRQSTN